MSILSIIGVVLGLAALVFGSMKGYSVFISALAGSLIMVIFSGISPNEAILTSFTEGFVGFIKSNFMVFAAGALMGKVYEITHGAKAVAKLFVKIFSVRFAPYAVFIAILIMTWGGIAGFVLAFSVFPIALEVFREANLPRYIIPGVLIGACCTASSWGPGCAQPANFVMANGFGTSLMAASNPSFIMALASVATTIIMMTFLFKRAKAKGEHFQANADDPIEEVTEIPNGVVALIPIIMALILINVKINDEVLLPTAFGIAGGAALAYIFMFKYRTDKLSLPVHIGNSFNNALTSIGNTAAMVAVGAVAQTTIGFTTIIQAITGMGGNPLISGGIAGVLVGFICGSATGATGLLSAILTPIYSAMGVNIEMFGRITCTAAHIGGTLPNGGFINTVITGISKDTYKNCFKSVFLLTTLSNIVATIVGIIVMTIMGVYA